MWDDRAALASACPAACKLAAADAASSHVALGFDRERPRQTTAMHSIAAAFLGRKQQCAKVKREGENREDATASCFEL
jgi:hypothetical protein